MEVGADGSSVQLTNKEFEKDKDRLDLLAKTFSSIYKAELDE